MTEGLDASTVLRAFNARGVRYVAIGAFAAIAAGAPHEPTFDIDFTPEASRENLDRLSLALTDLGAPIRAEGVPEGLPFAHDGASLGAVSSGISCATPACSTSHSDRAASPAVMTILHPTLERLSSTVFQRRSPTSRTLWPRNGQRVVPRTSLEGDAWRRRARFIPDLEALIHRARGMSDARVRSFPRVPLLDVANRRRRPTRGDAPDHRPST